METNNTGYIVFAHGSSIESANEAVRIVAADFASKGLLQTVEAAFLEGGKPDLAGALEAMADKVSRVVVVPYFLTLGLHLQRDLPRLIDQVKMAHPGLQIEVSPPLDQHPALIDALLDRALNPSQPLKDEACKPA
ncbi:MAG: CbiX/SirB N-terminal domain-containing protein [Acidobacteriota bacterium]